MPSGPTLTGRDAELAAIARLLERAAAGTGGHLVITGPPGSGRTAIADAAAALARGRGLPVARISGTRADPGLAVWTRLLTAADPEATPPEAGPDEAADPEAGRLAAALAEGGPRLLVVDDLDRAGPDARAFLPGLTARLGSGATALLVTAAEPLDLPPERRLAGLTAAQLAPALPPDVRHAVWLASAGLPGAATRIMDELTASDGGDAVVRLALTTPSRAPFLERDTALVRLLEAALTRGLSAPDLARAQARLARELLGDPTSGPRRRELIEGARRRAESTGNPGTLAEVLDCGLHALWDPLAAPERRDTAERIVALARRAGDTDLELRGLFWRFVARAELADLPGAESALTEYAAVAGAVGDLEAAVVVLSRQAMLATVRGRFAEAHALTDEVATRGRRIGLPDTERLVASLRGRIALLRGNAGAEAEQLGTMARRMPGHFYEAALARALLVSGRPVEAGLELERLLPAVLAGGGPRWLGAVADLAIVAARVGTPAAARELYGVLRPFHRRLVVWGGANTITGTVDEHLGLLAARTGAMDAALAHLDTAVEIAERAGALVWAVQALAARAEVRGAHGRPGAAGDRERARSIAERLGLPDPSPLGFPGPAPARGSTPHPHETAAPDATTAGGAARHDGTAAPGTATGGAPTTGPAAGRAATGPAADATTAGGTTGAATSTTAVGGAAATGAAVGGAATGGTAGAATDGTTVGGAATGGTTVGGAVTPRPATGSATASGTAIADGAAAGDRASDAWELVRDGDGWLLTAGTETARLRDVRGVRYLRTLLAAPGREIDALDLVAGGPGLRVGAPAPVLDDAARAAYRRRIADLDDRLDGADRTGDVDAAAAAQRERGALVAELRRSTGLGGRGRSHSDEAERARVNATRALWTVVGRIETQAPLAGAHLRASLRTGRVLRYHPTPEAPRRWRL
ncbi:hypothetical protein Val02_60490 [Virgisporangium aliadipatigenens]|uniref:AAA+ ATPase domain-containing protein n=1 Tax=Virgisporangium aliadipatigenens TaxID=741659 RepID=A0A8J3YSW7_9ACTN|nr:ATP-binding protein [Virgisporangium aliadipatigenens]GIJ49163.1 hypothetical protein Val02_60490 [Virgisporangium aliadipatigenens]